jgi:hypothetical protein
MHNPRARLIADDPFPEVFVFCYDDDLSIAREFPQRRISWTRADTDCGDN